MEGGGTTKGALALALMLSAGAAYSVDISKEVTGIEHFGHWQVIQIAGPQAILFRVASVSINEQDWSMTLDLSEACRPESVTLELDRRNSPPLEGPFLIFSYKVPRDAKTYPDLASVQASAGFAFLTFKNLTAEQLLSAHGVGTLSLWIPGSGDGAVSRSSNIYFSMDNFPAALNRAKKLCTENR